VKTIVWVLAIQFGIKKGCCKFQKCIRIQKSVFGIQQVFSEYINVYLSVGPICQKYFWKDTNFLKNEMRISNIGDFKKIRNHAKINFFLPHLPWQKWTSLEDGTRHG